jgi:plasmid stabilization system protein ParE
VKRLPVRWSAAARVDLLEILEFIQADRPKAARELAAVIVAKVRSLSVNPRRGRVVPELLEQGITGYRQVLVSSYRIILRVPPDTVLIETVIDTRRDLATVLLQRLLR